MAAAVCHMCCFCELSPFMCRLLGRLFKFRGADAGLVLLSILLLACFAHCWTCIPHPGYMSMFILC